MGEACVLQPDNYDICFQLHQKYNFGKVMFTEDLTSLEFFNFQPCPTTGDDFQAQQCAEYNSQIRYYNITPGSRCVSVGRIYIQEQDAWIPKYDGS